MNTVTVVTDRQTDRQATHCMDNHKQNNQVGLSTSQNRKSDIA